MRGLKKALLLAATRLPMDGKDIPGDAEKNKNWAGRARTRGGVGRRGKVL